jgi:hypothetical protein
VSLSTAVAWPHHAVFIDLLGPLPPSDSFKHVFVAVDRFSHYVELAPLADATATECARAFLEYWVCNHGVPLALVSDGGAAFTSTVFAEMCDTLRVKHHTSIAHTPSGHGVVERVIGIVQQVLRGTLRDQPFWSQSLPYVKFVLNSRVVRTIGVSPFEIVHGCKPRLPFHSMLDTPFSSSFPVPSDPLEFSTRLARGDFLSLIRARERDAHIKALAALKENRPEDFLVGDFVLMKSPQRNHCLEFPWWGPYCIEAVESPVSVVLRDLVSGSELRAHVSHLTHFIPPEGADLRAEALRPDEFLIERVLGHRRDANHKLHLHVKYVGFPEYDVSDVRAWAPIDDCKNLPVVKQYLKSHRLSAR